MADDFGRQLADLLYGSNTAPEDKEEQPSRSLRSKLTGAAETAATLGSGILGSVPAGLAGLSQLLPTRGRAPSTNRAAQKVEDVQSALTYLPRTEAGQEYLEKTAGALGVLGMPAEFLGEQTLKLTGSPFLATTANVGLDPVNYIGIPGTGKATVAATKATGRAIAAAPRVAGEMISDLVMPAPRVQAQRGAINLGSQIPEFQPQASAGLVSRADEALASLPRNKGTGAEFLRELQKTPGVKMAELEDRGLIDALSGMGKVTKADVLKVLEDNPPVKLEEVVLGQGRVKTFEEWAKDKGLTPEAIQDFGPSLRNSYEAFKEAEGARVGGTKYGQYTLPGGENYREILLKVPGSKPSAETEARLRAVQDRINELRPIIDKQPLGVTAERKEFNTLYDERDRLIQEREGVAYKSSHWNEPNVLAHARISDRTGANGEKILHVEEVQSDWHQQGRKQGYKGKEAKEAEENFKTYAKELADKYDLNPQHNLSMYATLKGIKPEEVAKYESLQNQWIQTKEGVPDAPFKKNWHELMMRRLVDYAAKNGYDRIAITPGAEQASRYDLSKQVDELHYNPETHRLIASKGGRRLIDEQSVPPEKLESYIGKEVASKIMTQEPNVNGLRSLTGQDLQVGGEGMKGFYDKILPTYLNELGKPYGVKVGQTDVITKRESRGVNIMTPDEPEIYPAQTMKVHSFDITPQMREAIKSKGLPLYAKGGRVHISDNPDTMRLELAAGGAVKAAKAAAKQAAKAAETTKKVSTNAASLTPLQSIQQGGYKIPPGGLSSEDKAALRPLYNQGLVKVEERGQEKFIVPGRGAWFEFATPEQKKALDQFQVAQNLKDLSFMGPTESLLNSAQASFYDFEISPGVRSIPIKMFEPFIGGYDSVHESKRIQDLTRAIQQSKQIEPLFVGLDPTGEPYIMEGQHRVRALKALGYDQIPARVVVDMDDITKAKGGAVSKRGGKVSITDNLDTMRLAVQKRK